MNFKRYGAWHYDLSEPIPDEEPRAIAIISFEEVTKEEAATLARQFAAAPDMLAALKAFIRWAEAEDDEYVDELIQVTKQARAAIAKAEGQ